MSPSVLFPIAHLAAPDGLATWDFAKMLAHHAHLTIGSDYFNTDPSPLAPCAAIMASVMSAMDDGGNTGEARLRAGAAIVKMLTLAGAEATGREGVGGSIEVGKRANFVTVDRDLSRGEFEGARVTGTWFQGGRVWDAAKEEEEEEEAGRS